MLHKDVVFFFSVPIFISSIKHYNNIIPNSIFNNFWNNVGVLFSLEEVGIAVFFFYLGRSDFFRQLELNFANWLELTCFATDESLSNFARSCADVESQRRCQHLTNAFGGMGTLGIDWAIMMTMQPSLTTKKTVTACEQALHLRNIERSRTRVASERRGGSRCGKKKWELFVSSASHGFTAHSRVRLPLEMERLLPVHNISW